MATLASNFKEIIQSSNFSLTTITTAGCYYLPGFDRVERDTNKKTDLRLKISRNYKKIYFK